VHVAFPSSEDVVFPNDPTVLLKASAHASAPTSSEPEGRSATHPGTRPMCVCARAGPSVKLIPETNVESGTSQSKSGASVNLSNSGKCMLTDGGVAAAAGQAKRNGLCARVHSQCVYPWRWRAACS